MFCAARCSLLLLLLLATPPLVSCARHSVGEQQDLLAAEATNTFFGADSERSPDGIPGSPVMEDVSHAQMNFYAAGFAAVAKMQPNLVEAAVTSLGEPVVAPNGNRIFRVKLYINGNPTVVAVDEQVPADLSDPKVFSFMGTNKTMKIWPVLIEKALAKVYGSYWTLHHRAGSSDVMTAITGLPVVSQLSSSTFNEYKFSKQMSKLVKAKSPMTARPQRGWHEVAVAGYLPGPKLMELYNPNANVEDQAVAGYSLGETDFLKDFSLISVGQSKWQRRSSIRIPVGEPVGLEFEPNLRSAGDRVSTAFRVDLDFPSELFTDSFACPLELEKGTVKLLMRRQGGADIGAAWTHGSPESPSRWSMEGWDRHDEYRGKWLIYVYTSFEHIRWLKEVTVTVFHGTHDVTIQRASDPLAVGREVMGFACLNIKDPGAMSYFDDTYLALPYLVAGAPAWRLTDNKDRQDILWLDVADYKIKKSPSLQEVPKYDQQFDYKVLKCKTPKPEDKPVEWKRPKQKRTPENKPCGFEIGDSVLLGNPNSGSTCAEIDGTFERSNEVRLRFHQTQTRVLECSNREIKAITQCHPFAKGDGILIQRDGRWVSDKVAQVGCGSILVEGGETVPCGKNLLGVQGNCIFRPGEPVEVFEPRKKKYSEIYGKVISHGSGLVTVMHNGMQRKFNCEYDDVQRLPRCIRAGLNHVERLQSLDNVQDIMDKGGDPLFPATRASIGPDGPDCGDFCDTYDNWVAIGSILN